IYALFRALIKQMTETFGGPNTPDYPLLQSGRFKNFRVNLELFWQTLIHKCKSFILFDSQFELFIQLLIHMSDSSIRTFRHTSTFSALKICTSMVEVIVELLKNLAINEKQMDVEKTKTKRVGKSEKLKFLEEQKVELDSNFDALRKLISLIFMSIFVHRYHDTVPDIRLICITELGRWMEIHPEHYIDDSYLKYIGWNLHDKAHEVRFACVNALAVQFRREDNWPKLELFASKFKQRILTLVLDVNENVAWEGCILLCSIQHAYPEMLETSETVHVMDAVFSLSKNLAIAGASFLECKASLNLAIPRINWQLAYPFQIDQEAEANGIPLTNQYFLKQVIEFLDSSKHKHASYLVDASLKIWPAMRDWKAMAEMLLAKDTFDDSRKERLLIDVLCCSVRQTATAELPPGRTNAYKAESKAKEARRIADEKEILTTDLIPSLPKLLQKTYSKIDYFEYIGDREQLSQLVALPQYFTLDVYLSGRNRNHLDALWSMLADIVEKYANDEVLMQTAETVSCLFSNDSVATILDKHKTKLMDTLAAAMNKACIAYPTYASQIDEATYEERKADLDAIFRKAAAFACIADLKRHNFAEQSLQLIKHHNNLSDAVIEKIIHILNIDLLNGLQIAMAEVDKKASCDEDKLKDIIKSLKIKQDVLVTQIDKIFTQKSPGMNMAFLTIADLWIFFSNGLPPDDSDNSRLLEELILEVNPDIQRNMIDYISEFVFKRDDSDDISEADKKELIQKRRTVLAAYVKLIIFGVIKKDDAAFLNSFKQNFKENFGDILKQLDVKLNKKKH
ncbi:hypothetical protein WR25_18633, partial [Diploscapter pachys]